MSQPVLLITPPFTQLNTPYPATAYLKGFLDTKNIESHQLDLGIEVILKLFCKQGLQSLFSSIQKNDKFSANANRIIALQAQYIQTIESVIHFLQGKNNTLVTTICSRKYLPEAARFAQLADLETTFGSMGLYNKAMYLATMYLEDISDLIQECIDPHFGFSRYAEKLARSANTFEEMDKVLQNKNSFIDTILLEILSQKIKEDPPALVCFTVPFPGNVYAALKCAQWLKENYPTIKIALGGGFANTELRQLSEPKVFAYVDFICLDDGEAPLENIIHFVENNIDSSELKRTYILQNNEVVFINNSTTKDYKQGEVGTPNYTGLLLDKYINVLEIANPMHSLWSNGRWNKLTMAHGCYWGKCTFCDISLDYISKYEPLTASVIVDKMETIISQTGEHGFHFVDEAAPPTLMKAMSIEILKRKLQVTWWANIRFEKSFTNDLCVLLQAAGCIAVSGGLEVASDRLLALIDKGITVAQVAEVNKNFTTAGIMVHAYLMYGYPTQTVQETVDSLEMVRQLFQAGIMQSAFWHQFALTTHSPIAANPAKYKIKIKQNKDITFAINDLEYEDLAGAMPEKFTYGLQKSLFNFMQGNCLDYALQKWFDFPIPKTTISPSYIIDTILESQVADIKLSAKYIYIGNEPQILMETKSKKGTTWENAILHFETLQEKIQIKLGKQEGIWLNTLLQKMHKSNIETINLQEIKTSFEDAGLQDFDMFWTNKPINTLYKIGLLAV